MIIKPKKENKIEERVVTNKEREKNCKMKDDALVMLQDCLNLHPPLTWKIKLALELIDNYKHLIPDLFLCL